jgi:hypothetical protein
MAFDYGFVDREQRLVQQILCGCFSQDFGGFADV